jgi:hypothetical protein
MKTAVPPIDRIASLPTDRKGLIRLAADLPVGDRKRRAILSGLKAGIHLSGGPGKTLSKLMKSRENHHV